MNDYGWALIQLRAGHRVTRSGWNGKDQCVQLMDWSEFKRMHPSMDLVPFTVIHTTDGKIVPWVPSQTDHLAEDWMLAP